MGKSNIFRRIHQNNTFNMKMNKKHHIDNECIFNNCTPLSTPRSISYIMNSNECYDYKTNKIEYISCLKFCPKQYNNIFKNSDIICNILSFLSFSERWKFRLLNKSFYQAFHTKYAWANIDFRFLNVDLFNFIKKYNKLFLNTFSLSMSINGDQSVEMIINFIFKHFNKLKDLRLYFRKKNANFIYESVHPIVSNLLNCKYLKNNNNNNNRNRKEMHKRKKKNSLYQKKQALTTTNNNNNNNNDNNNDDNNNNNNGNHINCTHANHNNNYGNNYNECNDSNEHCREKENLQTSNFSPDIHIGQENSPNISRHAKKKKKKKQIDTSPTKKEKNIEHIHNTYNSYLDSVNHYNDIHNNLRDDNFDNIENSSSSTHSSSEKQCTPFSYEHMDCNFELNDYFLQNNHYQKYLQKKNKEKKNEIVEKYLHIIQSKKIWASKRLNISNNFQYLERLIIDVELKGEELLCFVGKLNNLKDIIISKLVYSNKLNRSQSIIIFTSFIEKMKRNNIRLIQLGLYFRMEHKPIDYLNNEKFRKILSERKEYVYDINKEEGDELIYILQKNHLNSLYCLWSNDLFISFEMYEQIKKFNNLKIWILPGWRALSLAKQ
ncbi:hypothetical protein PFAG_01359 [Plasmodium falciparum Santa Lucia]|uniref:F-box domain-containing protein n=1 Tax=Plasmodium falciparum Santa Lucia TaxID=478859 RepID=W7G200_PLAFA|nr:hypothetical protein PFAG_01359 [Plasmodium falciparum Santa Lucia]